jgi:HEAT repeat protein
MKTTYHVFTLMILLSGVAAAQEQHLFNGKDLTGWDGKPGWWTVEDGALTSESTAEKKCHKANYLIWTGGEPADFELSLDFKLSPNIIKSNSGVQVRSERRPDWDTFGYQADMTATGHLTGFVYHHSRGLIAARGERVAITTAGEREVQKLDDLETVHAAFKVGEWNHYRIVCDGPDITLYVNGVLMCAFSDHDPKQARSKGIIALQMHPGPPMKVQFKNIVLNTLNATTREASLIAVLESDAAEAEKRGACRELALVGTSSAVPALAALLSDDRLSHLARSALQQIPGAESDAALRSALQQLSGESLAGVIHTIGQRGDPQAVGVLLALLDSADARVAQTCAAALGKIGTAAAAQGLQRALPSAQGMLQLALCDGLLDCAAAFEGAGKHAAAASIYDALQGQPDLSKGSRAAALRAAILIRGKDGLPLLAESIRSDDVVVLRTGLRTALELQGAELAQLLADELQHRSAERQQLLIGVLGQLGEPSVLATLFECANAGDPSVRLAAIHAACQIGGTAVIAPLMEWMQDSDSRIAQAAAEGLTGLHGAAVDDAVVQVLGRNDSRLQASLAAIAAKRRIATAMPVLADLMQDAREPVRLAAIKSYGELADVEQLPVLLSAILPRTQQGDITALGKAIAVVCITANDPNTCLPQLFTSYEAAVPEAKPMLLKILKRIGGPDVMQRLASGGSV